ncbi:parathyroid hormone/parathyroid hormone-related peptide receptor-like protein [Leptotrombidium deliense]|uniref:Parathyroid hormone/parathyroid hormone-related peptide receptor-like protein n=1 Tax=Leptotrombidium deliense TaxID=299467 RepID=A0A443S0S4_9ACAR|nr:parathyroid hormone/parathyroid hormone-related peptide receptor-like protein [Leptotrombidium deliense]
MMFTFDRCPWQNNVVYSYIFQAPFVIVILINIFFLQKILWVLFTKLRATTNVESKQYRKASKALLVLIPLLGVTHALFLVTPTSQTAKRIVTYVQAAFLSTQNVCSKITSLQLLFILFISLFSIA